MDDSVSTEYRVRHEDGELLHVMGNIKVIEKDGEKFYQRFLLDVTDQKAHEEQKDRRVRDLIQALSEDYMVVCAFGMDTGRGDLLRLASGEDSGAGEDIPRRYLARPHHQGRTSTRACTRTTSRCWRDVLSADGIMAELKLRERFDKLYRAHRGSVVQYRQATVVRFGNWKDHREVVIGFRNVDQQFREAAGAEGAS